jgi:hypothetical protein
MRPTAEPKAVQEAGDSKGLTNRPMHFPSIDGRCRAGFALYIIAADRVRRAFYAKMRLRTGMPDHRRFVLARG